ncbi:MAG: bifunctional methylenetetrahydrofolate dehydrogenase/methenyltetrahydrofolate cyclohydrolase FolD [Clostridiales bacterium]|nr:bifunctional methylenetetrahydrofolate dehydrogenase/methenyltetrahydrofolate cyclohydrolase FolD [Clostridiales bacterium]
MSIILDGKLTAEQIRLQIKQKTAKLATNYGFSPKLAIVIVGKNPASLVYVASKERACVEVGFQSVTRSLNEVSTQEDIINEIKSLASDKTVNGIMVQLPLPKGIDESAVLTHIPPEKDVDGLTVLNGGACLYSLDGFTPCTPRGIIELLTAYNVDFCGKHAVVVGRSNLVGKPIAIKLLDKNCTVTICHSRTQNLENITKQADILVVAVGRKHLVTAGMVKEGAVVVDVGINRVDGKLYGDVDFDAVSNIASMITPVPGGIGPMTVAMLLANTFDACLKQNHIRNDF